MAAMVNCRSCGRPIAAGDRFCRGCGTAIDLGDETVLATPLQHAETGSVRCLECGTSMGKDARFCPQCGTPRPEPETVVLHLFLRNAQALRLIEATKGEFEILQQLGSGAMGAVYLARDIALDRKVAIKVIAPHLLSDETMISRFRQEAQTIASLRHPNIVNVHAVRQSADMHYFVMEFIDGPPLRSIVKAHAPLDIDVTQAILFQVGSALSHAHRSGRGVIHRDVKPANIMLDREGDAFVTDFGISKIQEAQTGLTQTGATIGTPEYMSPEQCRGDVLTGASDQYALGIVAYEMLCGHTPFSGNQYQVMVAHTSELPRPIREIRPDCPPHVADAVERMLAKSPADRWPDLDSAVMAMGGAPLGYHDPVRHKIKELIGATVTHIPAVGAPSRGSVETATSVTVIGLPPVLETGERVPLRAEVRGSGNVSLSGLGVVWASTDPSIARVEGGFVEGVRPGTVSIMASAGNVATSVVLAVAEPQPASVVVRPSSIRMHKGGRFLLAAQVHDKRGRPMQRDVRWRSSDPRVATVSAKGEVLATGIGPVSISAQAEGASGTAEIVVEAPAVEASMPPSAPPPADPDAPEAPGRQPGLPAGVEQRPAASRSRPVPSGRRPAASTSATRPLHRRPAMLVASIVIATGMAVLGVRLLGSGNERSASSSGASLSGGGSAGETPLGVDAPTTSGVVPSHDPTPGASSPGVEGTAPAGAAGPPPLLASGGPPAVLPSGRAQGGDAGGPLPASPQTVSQAPRTSAPRQEPAERQPVGQQAASAPAGGAGVGGGPGASEPSAQGPASLRVVLPNRSLRVGQSETATAQVLGARGAPLRPGSYTLAWRSGDASVAVVDPQSGAVSATGPGTAWIVAAAGSARDSVLLTVVVPVASVEIAEEDLVLEVGASRALSVTVFDGSRQPVDEPVTWTSSDPAVARVDAVGRLTAAGPGSARVTASSQGVRDEITVSVSRPAPELPSAEEVRATIEAFVTMIARGDQGGVSRFGGSAPGGRLDDLLGLMRERNFAARLEAVETPSLEGGVPTVSFRVATTYRTFAGANRSRTLAFRGQLERAGTGWQLASVVLQ
jgi:uncharacterized protein YjdB